MNRRLALVPSLASVVLLVAACGGDSGGGGAEGEPIKIGFFSPTTGATSADGVNARNGAELATEKCNEEGIDGRNVELVTYDDAGDPAQAVTIARRLVQQDGAVGVVSGAYSPPTTAAAPIFQQAQVPMLSAYAVSPKITDAGDYIFRAGPAGQVEGSASALFIAEKLPGDPTLVSVLTADLDPLIVLSTAMKERAAQEGLEIVSDDKFALSDTDFRPLLSRVRNANPDVIYAAAYYDQTAQLLSQAKELGLTAPFIFGSTSDSYKIFELAGDAAEGSYLTTDFDRGDRPVVQEFITVFEARYASPPDIVAAAAYDAVLAMCKALENAESIEGPEVRAAIEGLEDVDELVTGPVSEVTSERDFARPLSLQIAKGGEWTPFAQLSWEEVTGG